MKLTAKNKMYLGWTALIAGFLALAYYLFQDEIKDLIKGTKGGTKPDEGPKPGGIGGTTNPINMDRLLKKGVKGAEVTELQKRLKKDGGAQLLGLTGPGADGVDGVFGPKTESALLKVKGVVQITLKNYGKGGAVNNPNPTQNNTSSNVQPFVEGWLNNR